jgi:hypothetical protein
MVVGWFGGGTNVFVVTQTGGSADKWVRENGKNRFGWNNSI